MKRLAITGSSGYLGRKFVEHLRRVRSDVEILGLDICPPGPAPGSPHRFTRMDILSPDLGGTLSEFRPDSVIHAAFVVAPIRDRRKMRRVNVEGSRNLLDAAGRCGAERLMLVSSATAYGAWPDNPVPIEEGWPLRPAKFQYAAEKVEVEAIAGEFAERHPEITVSCVRPAIIGGPRMNNYIYRFIFQLPVLALLDGCDTPVQFVHEEDCAAAMLAILTAGARGAFNIGPTDWSSISEIAVETRRWTVRLPFWLARKVHGLAWSIRLPVTEAPVEFLDFARYPWVVAPRRLEQELGYQFQYTSRETLLEIVHSRQSPEEGRLTPAR